MADLQWDRVFALEQSCDDEEILAELIDTMKRSACQDLERIKNGLQAAAADAVEHSAHSLKGAAASLGFNGIRDIAKDMEFAARAGDLALQDKLAALTDLVGQLNGVT